MCVPPRRSSVHLGYPYNLNYNNEELHKFMKYAGSVSRSKPLSCCFNLSTYVARDRRLLHRGFAVSLAHSEYEKPSVERGIARSLCLV